MEENTEREEDAIKIDISRFKKTFENKKVVIWSTIIFLAAVIVSGIWIRTLNISFLKDVTTGKYIPLALDPFYWLRMAQTIVQQGHLPAVDSLRIIKGGMGFSRELLPTVIVWLYELIHIFNGNVTLQYADIIYPIVAFVLGIIVFYFLVMKLTKSKLAAGISTAFLAMIPTYLYRTMAGFADHDALGTFAFFLTLLAFTYSLGWVSKEKDYQRRKNFLTKPMLLGALIGVLSAFTLVSWGGIFEFLTMIIPLSYTLLWILKTKKIEHVANKELLGMFSFYTAFIFISLVAGLLIFKYPLTNILDRFIFTPTAVLVGGAFAFTLIDLLIIKYHEKIKLKNIESRHIIWSAVLGAVLGLIVVIFYKGGVGSFFGDIVNKLLHPFGTARVSLTVAENAQPYIADWISQTGPIFFWLFFAGLTTFGINISRGIRGRKNKLGFIAVWILLIAGLLLSRISASSILNGTNFISQLFYFGSVLVFFLYCVKIYRKSEIRISEGSIVLFSAMVFMLIAARGAQRLIFTVTPFACLFVGYLIFSLWNYWKRSSDDTMKLFLVVALLVVVVLSILSFRGFVSSSITQASNTGPSANLQWQNAMAWVRNNTAANAIFAHWWDYGYWVEYLGERATIADGGHFEGAFRDHLIGRYLLTEPNPAAALSFMKSNNVTNLLIDQSDLGKYGAFSIIGSDTAGTDRYAQIPVMPSDPTQTRETSNGTLEIYSGGTYIYQDIVYNGSNGQQVFLPQGQAGIGAVGVELSNTSTPESAFGIFVYNGQQYTIPLRYVYIEGHMYDLGTGINATADVIPSISVLSGQVQVNRAGAVIYLSPKVSASLYAQLYLLNDSFNEYPTVKLVHSEPDSLVQSLNQQGANLGDFVYYGGFRGPIKIWNVTYPSNIISHEQFTRKTGTYAEFDNLTFSN